HGLFWDPEWAWWWRTLLALLRNDSVGDGARVNRQPVVMDHAAQLRYLFCGDIELDELEHLCVAILLHHVNAIMIFDEVVHVLSEGISTQAQIISSDVVFRKQLVARLSQRPVRGAVSNDADL